MSVPPDPPDVRLGVPSAYDLLWGSRPQHRRGPRPSLSAERIVAEAIALADAEGLANLSMQHLAQRLGCAKMALYRHVPGKAELVALMLDTALGPPPAPPGPPAEGERAWRAVLRRWTTTMSSRYRAHPWAIEATTGARLMGPNELAWLEAALAGLAGTGLTGAEQLDAVVLLLGHVRSLIQVTPSGREDLEKRIAGQVAAVLSAYPDRFPLALAAFTDPALAGRDDALDFGIDRILDGLAALVAARRRDA